MRISKKGLDLIKEFEGLRLVSYKCPAGIWTIGYGSTGPHVGPNMAITELQAEALLLEDVRRFEEAVTQACAGYHTEQEEFDAMVSLAYNVGIANFKKSSVLRLHKAGKKAEAANSFGMWNKARVDGVLTVLAGLTRRRAREKELYLSAGGANMVERKTAGNTTVLVPEESVVPEAPKPLTKSREIIIGSGLGVGSVINALDEMSITDLAATKKEIQDTSKDMDGSLWDKVHGAEIAGVLVGLIGIFMIVKRIRDRNKGIR